MQGPLVGKGIWTVTLEQTEQALRAAPEMGLTHILPKIADTPMDDDGVRRPLYYQRALPSRQMISAAGLTPIGWIFMRLLYPEAEAEFIMRALDDGYAGVILNVETPCAGMHDAAQQLVAHALTLGVNPYVVYNCSFPNIESHTDLPYAALNDLCRGGIMPMAYASFYRSNSTVPPAEQAQRVIDTWAYAHYERFYSALSYKPPIYPILGPFHEYPEFRRQTPAEFQPWLERLAIHAPTFVSFYDVNCVAPELYPLIKAYSIHDG